MIFFLPFLESFKINFGKKIKKKERKDVKMNSITSKIVVYVNNANLLKYRI